MKMVPPTLVVPSCMLRTWLQATGEEHNLISRANPPGYTKQEIPRAGHHSFDRLSCSLAGNDLSPNFLAQDFAHLIARQCCDIVDAASVKSTDFLFDCGNQAFKIDRFRSFEDDMDLFLAAVVLHGKQANAVEAKKLAQPLLDGRRGNLLSLHIDDIGDASLQRDSAIGSHDREIAGIEEAVPEEGPRRRFVIEVAGRPPCSADPHLPDLADWYRVIRCIDDLDPPAGHESMPSLVLWSVQRGECHDAALSGNEIMEEMRRNAGLGLLNLGLGHCSGADSELHRIVARERAGGRGQNGGEHCRVKHRVGNSWAQQCLVWFVPLLDVPLLDESGAAHNPRAGRPLVTTPGPSPKVEHTEQAMLVYAEEFHMEPKDVGVGLGTHQHHFVAACRARGQQDMPAQGVQRFEPFERQGSFTS